MTKKTLNPEDRCKFYYASGAQADVTCGEYKQLCLDKDPAGLNNDLPKDLTYADAEYVVDARIQCNTFNFGEDTNNAMLLGWEQQLLKDTRMHTRYPRWHNMMLQAIMARVTEEPEPEYSDEKEPNLSLPKYPHSWAGAWACVGEWLGSQPKGTDSRKVARKWYEDLNKRGANWSKKTHQWQDYLQDVLSLFLAENAAAQTLPMDVDLHVPGAKDDEEFLAETFHNIKDPHGIPQHDPGAKNDMEKVRMDLVFGGFPRALHAIGQVATMGARKYSDGGWLHVPDGKKRYFAAMQRHFLADMMEETNDAESGLSHLAHAAWNAMAILELQLRDKDNPPKSPDFYMRKHEALQKAQMDSELGLALQKAQMDAELGMMKADSMMKSHEEAFRKNNDFRNVDQNNGNGVND